MKRDAEALLDHYARELADRGARVNLVGSTRPEAIREHFEDALAAAGAIPEGARVVDLGSGAGLPGLPIAIARPDVHVTLVEIRERRVHFLRHVARALPVRCEIVRASIEAPPAAPEHGIALLRAVAPLHESLRLGRPWVRPGGEVWIWTRERAEALPEAERALASEVPLGPRGRVLRIPIA